MTEPGRVMALDLGTKRIGVAMSDELRITGQPYKTLENKSSQSVLAELKDIISRENVMEVVIGLPKRLDGSAGDMAEAAKKLATLLKEQVGIKVRLWDERFSTHAAQRALLEGDVRRAKRKQVVDQTAAAWILQGYLDSRPRT